MQRRFFVFTFVLVASTASSADAAARISSRLERALATTTSVTQPVLCIAYFLDHDGLSLSKNNATGPVSPRAIARRSKVLPAGQVLDETDIPVPDRYVDAVAATGVALRHRLKWFNAVTFSATAEQILAIKDLSCIASVDIVGRYKREPSVDSFTPSARTSLSRISGTDPLDYGPSLNALSMINVPAVHKTGNTAQGILIGLLDNGFRLLTHQAFDTLRPRILATRDFVDHKISVVPNNPTPSFGSHGIWTLSALAGYAPGRVVGPAYGASFLLARTENDSSETPIEEDNWAAAIQWAESLGVEVTSTSLGFLEYDTPYTSWTWQDMDGKTTLITRAAALAVKKGVVVVNSAGNNGPALSGHNTLNAPADADTVIAVGAVTASGFRAGFSSEGPTTSDPPRIKPDVVAQGEHVAVASSESPTGYGTEQGTSFSCPLTAGVAALVLKAHPLATPYEILTRLRLTASNAASPNNAIGWGIINAAAAIAYNDSVFRPSSPVVLSINPNPFFSKTTLHYEFAEPSRITFTVYDLLGRAVRHFPTGDQGAVLGSFTWDGSSDAGYKAATGIYLFRLSIEGASGITVNEVKKVMLIR